MREQQINHCNKKDNSMDRGKHPLMKISDGLKKQTDAKKMNMK